MKFADYPIAAELKKSISEMGFTRPTDIQFKSIPAILRGENVFAIAQTGTGKTAAFAIPTVQLLLKGQKHKSKTDVKCLIMVPTRELAIQIAEVFQSLSRYTPLNIVCVVGGMEQEKQIAELTGGVDILVSTPGRMFDLISQQFIKLSKLEILILDESDKMFDMGFIKDIRDVIKLIPKKRQTLFFSATINKEIKKMAYDIVENPIRIQISPKNSVSKNVTHTLSYIEQDDKRFFLERITNENPESKILVFVRTKVRAERVSKAMDRVEIKNISIHGDKTQEERLEALRRFKNGLVKMMITTDVSARGIDISEVDFVINYDLPDDPENYVHRVGRTGRGNKKGYAVSFCSSDERKLLKEIEKYIGGPIEEVKISKEEYHSIIDFSQDARNNWGQMIEDAISQDEKHHKQKKRK